MVIGGCTIEVSIKTCADGKCKKLVSGVNNGCTACEYSPAEYNCLDTILTGTEMNRSFANNMEVGDAKFCSCYSFNMLVLQVWERLVLPGNTIKKCKDDFNTRHGVTQKPLADLEWIGMC